MVAGILEKSNRLRKAFFIVKRLPISGTAEGRAKPRIVGRVFLRKPRRGTYLLRNCQCEPEKPEAKIVNNMSRTTPNLELASRCEYHAAGNDDGASAGTVVPADANQGVSPFLI